MTRCIVLLFSLQLMLLSCKEQPQLSSPSIVKKDGKQLSEMITKGFAVKLVDGNRIQDTLQQMQSITYDGQGREESNIFYSLDGAIQWRDVYEYNEDNFKIGSKFYEEEQNKISYKYEIDDLGRRLKYVAYDAQSAATLYDGYSTYEDDGKVRKDGFKNNVGVILWQYEYLFDKDQNELGYVYIDVKTGKRYASSYKVLSKDSINRWTKRGIYENDTLRGVEERIYKYN